MMLPPISKLHLSVALSTTFSFALLYLWWRLKRVKTYVKVGRVKKLFFFPVKSLKGIEVDHVLCTKKGVEVNGILDRSFMLITEDGVLLSQRIEPRMVLLTPSISGNQLCIEGPDTKPLKVDIKNSVLPSDKIIECKIFNDTIKAVDCGDEAAHWFQNFLKRKDIRLVHYTYEFPERKFLRDVPFIKKFRKENQITFQDLVPFHLATDTSINELNEKIGNGKISVHNFRPNIFIEDSAPFDEDNWKYLRFSSGVEMCNVLPCGRCLLTTNDPETGVKTDKEPLVTLRKFRMPKNQNLTRLLNYSPCFGIECTLLKSGEIQTGDFVFAVVQNGLFKFK